MTAARRGLRHSALSAEEFLERVPHALHGAHQVPDLVLAVGFHVDVE